MHLLKSTKSRKGAQMVKTVVMLFTLTLVAVAPFLIQPIAGGVRIPV